MKVVFPVPFSPSITRISESVNDPASTFMVKLPWGEREREVHGAAVERKLWRCTWTVLLN